MGLVIGSVLMTIGRVYAIHSECSGLAHSEQVNCGMGQMVTYLVVIALPIYIAVDIGYDVSNRLRAIWNFVLLFVAFLLWTIIMYQYDVDPLPFDGAEFKDDISFVVRLG